MPLMRLDKYLAAAAGVSRTQADGMIRAGRVSVDGAPVRQPDRKIDETSACILLDGRQCEYRKHRYFMLDKPVGVLTACRDSRQKTVLDCLPAPLLRGGIAPVGRLDKDTSGLLLLTDDGEFAHRIISPRYGVQKKYYAEVDGSLREEDIAFFRTGVVLQDGTRCLPAGLEILSEHTCLVTVHEGKYHQVRRMLAAAGKPVLKLRRLEVGCLTLDPGSEEGQLRELSDQELCMMFKLLGMEK